MVEAVKLLTLAIAAAVIYGIGQDQVTARVCVEYFTIGHPRIMATEEPTILALGWGILATWWVGLVLGIPLVLVCRIGAQPKLTAREVLRPIGILLLVIGFTASIAGVCGFLLAKAGIIWLEGQLTQRVPQEKHALFLADGWAHGAAYLAGFLGSLVVLGWLRRERKRRARLGAAGSGLLC